MLQINPYFRPSAYELLQNPLFDEIRISKNEFKSNECPINISFDEGKQAYNYEHDIEGSSLNMREFLTEI